MANKFGFPVPRMPTEEEHRAVSAKWLARVGPCLYENWPQPLKDVSFRTGLVELTRADQAAIRSVWQEEPDQISLDALAEKIDAEIHAFDPAGCFVKLSSRSPKDFYYPEVPKLTKGGDVIHALLSSMRIIDDMLEYRYVDAPCYLLLREFRFIPAEQEFRCFIRDGRIAGITQYEYQKHFPNLVQSREAVAARCFAFVDSILPKLHIQNVVVDVWLGDEPVLIEINPYGSSDPCLFSYPELEAADRLFRIVESEPEAEPG